MDTRTTRRGVLLGVGAVGVGGVLAACSTAAVPFDADEAGQLPDNSKTPTAAAAATDRPGTGATTPSPGEQPGSEQAGGVVLGQATDIPVGGGVIYTAEKVVVTQPAKGEYRAFSAVCTHVGCILDKIADGTIDCPCHGSEFKISTGAVVTGPAPAPLPRKKIKIEGGKVILL